MRNYPSEFVRPNGLVVLPAWRAPRVSYTAMASSVDRYEKRGTQKSYLDSPCPVERLSDYHRLLRDA